MSNTELKVMFSEEKLEALRFFLGKKELTVEQELKDTLDKTYEKVVPAHVREYVESKIEQAPTQEQVPEPEAQEQQRQSRQTRRQREQTAASTTPVHDSPAGDASPTEEEDQNQGMNMSM